MELMVNCKKCNKYTELDSDAETREELADSIGSQTFTIHCGNCGEDVETNVNFIYAEKGDLEKYGPAAVSIVFSLFLASVFTQGFILFILFFSLSSFLLFQTYVNKKLSDLNTKRVK